MFSATAAVGARSAAARVPGSAWQGAPAPVEHTAGVVREARPRRLSAPEMHVFPRLYYTRRV